jgi:flagellar biosynthesis GTPase FlhF
MQLYTFKARSLAEALRLVRDELGPDASVLHTREVGSPLMRLLGGRAIEVTASAELAAPTRLPEPGDRHSRRADEQGSAEPSPAQGRIPAAELQDFRRKFRRDLHATSGTEPSLVEQLAVNRNALNRGTFSGAAAIADRLRTAGVSQTTATRWLQRLEAELACDPECHPDRMLDRLRQIIAADLANQILR